jgi:S-methylmethionine-dependent homocysteine/selenocysteine methylase
MSRYRHALPQLDGGLFATDGGLETTMIYHEGIDLPCFAAFVLMADEKGRATLRRYFERYMRIADAYGLGMVLESPTWRASRDWAAHVGCDEQRLDDLNRRSIALMDEIRRAHESAGELIVVSGNIGPRGDGYVPDRRMSARAAYDYHGRQVETFAGTAADMVAAFTINYVEEGIGIAKAARANGMPVAVSFTVETDGRLPSGQTLESAIAQCDAETGAYPAYYMVNCAHTTHFAHVLERGHGWQQRIGGIRANASARSHAELDAMTEIDAGDPDSLAKDYGALREKLPALSVVGGCCGTDHRHVERICDALTEALAMV